MKAKSGVFEPRALNCAHCDLNPHAALAPRAVPLHVCKPLAAAVPAGKPAGSNNHSLPRCYHSTRSVSLASPASSSPLPPPSPPRNSSPLSPPSTRNPPCRTRRASCASRLPTASRSSSATPATSTLSARTAAPPAGSPAARATRSFPRFSPDGKQLAFTGQYDGNTEVYVMPGRGRRAQAPHLHRHPRPRRRLRPHGAEQHRHGLEEHEASTSSSARACTPSTTSSASSTPSASDGGLPEQLPLPRGGFVSFSPDDRKIAYNRVFREFRTWKRYRGGMADDIWIYDFKTGKDREPHQQPRAGHLPDVGAGNKIYFLSDRDGQHEPLLHRPRHEGNEAADHLQGLRHQVPVARARTPSSSRTPATSSASTWPAGRRRRCRSASRKTSPSGRAGHRRCRQARRIRRASRRTASALLVVARGDMFTVPGQGRPAAQPDQHFRRPRARRELVARRQVDRLHLRRHRRGRNLRPRAGRQGRAAADSPSGADTYKYAPIWSPDSKKILWTDRMQRLRYVDVATKAVTLVDQDEGRRDPRLRLVARQPVDHLRAGRKSRRHAEGLPLFASPAASASRSPTAGTPPATRPSATTASICSSSPRATSTRSTASEEFPTSTATWSASTSSRWPRRRPPRSRPRSDEVGQDRDDKKDKPDDKKPQAGRQEGRPKPQEARRRSRSTRTACKDRIAALPIPPRQLPQPAPGGRPRLLPPQHGGDDDGDDEEGGRRCAESQPVRLQPEGPQGDRPRQGQRLRDHRRRQEDARQGRQDTASSTCRRTSSNVKDKAQARPAWT